MTTGYPLGVEFLINQEDFDEDDYNIIVESWSWNREKSHFGGENLERDLLARH